MFYRGKVQICIKLESLVNIFIRDGADIKIKIGVHHQDPVFGKIQAKPVNLLSTHLLPSMLTSNAYISRPIRVYSSVQSVQLQDTILWTTYIDGFQPIPVLKIIAELFLCRNNQDLHLKTVQLSANILTSSFLPIYFDQFGFVSNVQAQIHSVISKFQFHNNEPMVKQLITQLQKENKREHIKKNNNKIIPPVVKSFSDFIIMTTNDNKKKLDMILQKFIKVLNGSKTYIISTISHFETTNNIVSPGQQLRQSMFDFNSSFQKRDKRKIFGANQIDHPPIDTLIHLENISCQINNNWEVLVQFINYTHPNYSFFLRRLYFNQLQNYYFNKQMTFTPPLILKNQIPIQAVPLQTNCYKIFIDNYRFKKSQKSYNHLVIFVHGINAHSFDMQGLRNMLKFFNPKIYLHLSRVNEERTNDKISDQGQRLSIQIKNLIKTKYSNTRDLKISFISHSMGGLISRASLQYLEYYKQNLHAFITLCSPHLGQLLHPSTFIKTTMFLLNKFNPSDSMLQLNMQDDKPQQSYIYKLSLSQQLSWFKSIVLVNILQDNIVPRCSARIQQASQTMVNMPQYRLFHRMVYNITKHLDSSKITRIQFQGSGSSDFDSFIGKSQHIQLIKDLEAIRILNVILYKLF